MMISIYSVDEQNPDDKKNATPPIFDQQIERPHPNAILRTKRNPQFEILEYGHDSFKFKGCWAIEKIVPLKIKDLL